MELNEDVIVTFSVAEAYFLSSTKKLQNKIVSKNALIVNCMVLEKFDKVRRSSPDNIKKEIAFNLLEELLTLYICVRTFSYVKDNVQAFKIRNSETKLRSLRTGVKQIYIIHPLKMCKITMKKAFFELKETAILIATLIKNITMAALSP